MLQPADFLLYLCFVSSPLGFFFCFCFFCKFVVFEPIELSVFGSSAEISVCKICLPLSLVRFVLGLPLPLNQELSSAKVGGEKGDL
jgi:hypothetical protein